MTDEDKFKKIFDHWEKISNNFFGLMLSSKPTTTDAFYKKQNRKERYRVEFTKTLADRICRIKSDDEVILN